VYHRNNAVVVVEQLCCDPTVALVSCRIDAAVLVDRQIVVALELVLVVDRPSVAVVAVVDRPSIF